MTELVGVTIITEGNMKKWTRIILSVLVMVAVLVWAELAKSPSADEIKNGVQVYFLNVGQGDAELIQKGDYQILIDGGPDDKVLSEIGKVMPTWDRKIEEVILSHPHADHIVGLNSVLDRYEIGTIYYSGVIYDSNVYKEFLDKIKTKKIPLKIPKAGEKETEYLSGQLTFLWPGEKYSGKSLENLNNSSEVISFCYFSHCALFTGDIETDEQATMLSNCHSEGAERPKNLEADRSFAAAMPTGRQAQDDNTCSSFQSEILKLAHHGSTNGTNQKLLDMVKPKYGVIEVGTDNKYGHPHAAVLDLLQKGNIQYSRTDRDGTVEFILSETGLIKK